MLISALDAVVFTARAKDCRLKADARPNLQWILKFIIIYY